jgi:uncharacterized phiE125 gp8 family phage protein
MAIDTLANIKGRLLMTETTSDDILSRLLDAAESFVEQHTRRAFGGGTFTELHPAGQRFLFLANWPVTTVATLRVDPNRVFGSDTARAVETFVVLRDRGVIASRTGPFLPPQADNWPAAVQVVYTTATNTVPAAVREAVGQLVSHWYSQTKTNVGLNFEMLTENTAGTNTKTYSWALTAGLKTPPGVLELLEPFRVPTL